ncbi:hypothetical protein F5146DRAFT_1007047 [Armillaria mellea]|nr:hypothetical protein F5146DRAFT_1007047 [Armillaria mellea]
MYQFLRPLVLQFSVPVRGTLGDLERLGLKLQSLHQGIRGRSWPTSAPITVEYMMNQSITHFPPIVVSISSTITSLSGSVKNGYLIDALVAETLANHLPTPQWPSHLNSFHDSLDILDSQEPKSGRKWDYEDYSGGFELIDSELISDGWDCAESRLVDDRSQTIGTSIAGLHSQSRSATATGTTDRCINYP